MKRAAIRRRCLSFRGATMDHPWGDEHDAFKVGGRMFALIGSAGGVSFKASDIGFEVLTETGKARPAPYMARAKWVHVDEPDDWPDNELADHLEHAYELVAAKLTKAARKDLGLA